MEEAHRIYKHITGESKGRYTGTDICQQSRQLERLAVFISKLSTPTDEHYNDECMRHNHISNNFVKYECLTNTEPFSIHKRKKKKNHEQKHEYAINK